MTSNEPMTTQDTLLAYSEWLDSQHLIVGESDPDGDDRTHEQLAQEFIRQWEAEPKRSVLAGRMIARLVESLKMAAEEFVESLPKS